MHSKFVSLPTAALWTALAAALVVLVGCSTASRAPAPVVDRSATSAQAAAQRALPRGAENAGKPGYYTVQPGDTLMRIGLDRGYSWRDLQAWNQLDNPDRLEVGQVLRVAPPDGASAAVVSPVPSSTTVIQRPVDEVRSAPAAQATPPSAPAAPLNIQFVWPANGNVVATFDENSNKGIGIAGKLGDPVVAAADGRVVYAGSLRGYGNLVVINHNNTVWTAYAHNQALLVKEDQTVRQGQRIADMGSSDSDTVKLHFEVRRQGKPVDPLPQLPRR